MKQNRTLLIFKTTWVLVALLYSQISQARSQVSPTDMALWNLSESIWRFYAGYFPALKDPQKTAELRTQGLSMFSQEYQGAVRENLQLCTEQVKNEICGWGIGGDPFLDAQEFGENLNVKNTKFHILDNYPTKTLEANFNLMPELNDSAPPYHRKVAFVAECIESTCVIKDMIYVRGNRRDSSLEHVKREIERLKNPPNLKR